jgi:hypothetical protein
MFSGGVGSWAAAKLVAEEHGTGNLVLLFADTKIEDPDLYRFLHEAASEVGGQLVVTAEGRTPWEVFRDVRFLGNHRLDPCSRVLKREHLRTWLEERYDPADVTVHLGIDWTEEHRFTKAQGYWAPWRCEAPLLSRVDLDKEAILCWVSACGIRPPRLYEMGFPHNNCGGGCIKAGMAHFKLLLRRLPDVYAEWERNEQDMRDFLGKDVAILTDRSGGRSGASRRPLTLREFRERVEVGERIPGIRDWGACSCFAPLEPEQLTLFEVEP